MLWLTIAGNFWVDNIKNYMAHKANKKFAWVLDQAPVWILLLLGVWLVVLRPLGPHLSLVPGDLGDARFNNYLLEHFYRWIQGLDKSFWNTPFFYPFPNTISFSDNLLGSGPIYTAFRMAGLDRESAYQGWYITGYLLNYLTAAWVLNRLKLKPLAVAVAAFFFTFGLLQLAQETHAQLLYRCGIPIACYLLWLFYQEPRLKTLAWLVFWVAWQLFAGIYIGVFLLFLQAVLVVLLPFFYPLSFKAQNGKTDPIWLRILLSWPARLKQAWMQSKPLERLASPMVVVILAGCLGALLRPYYDVTLTYGFSRTWDVVTITLPRLQSYFIADNSPLWQPFSSLFADFNARREHQLFPGGMFLGLTLLGGLTHLKSGQRRWAFANLAALLILIGLTLYIHGFSFYKAIWKLPGMNSIRAVTRIDLVLMWPLSIFCAYAIDAFLQQGRLWINIALIVVTAGLLAESAIYNHITYSKADAQARITSLRALVPAYFPVNPVLFIGGPPTEPYYQIELDGMILAQELGWPTLNGYSGNFPEGFAPATSCEQISNRILGYMTFERINDPLFYTGLASRIVPLGFQDCDPATWKAPPN